MFNTYYYWNNEVFTDAEELKDAIIDFISEYKNDRIMSIMDEIGCDWSNAHDCEICRGYAVDGMVLDIIQNEVKIKNELFTTSGKQIQNLPRLYYDIARRKLCLAVYY